jgi:hypothetical protein
LPFPATCGSKQHPTVLYLELKNSCLEEQSVQIRQFCEMEPNMIQLNHGKEKKIWSRPTLDQDIRNWKHTTALPR